MRRKSRAAREAQRLRAENDVLREMVGKLSSTLSERVIESEAENDKLRELLEAVLQCAGETKLDKGCDACPMYNGPWRNDDTWCLLRPTLRELGVVDE